MTSSTTHRRESPEMELLCVGLSYRTAPLALRERLVLPEARQTELMQRLAQAPTEALVLSTCNRVELYLATPHVSRTLGLVREELEQLGGAEVRPHLYDLHGPAALLHLFRVASSLDSMVLGEAQVLGQVKRAFEQGREAGSARKELSRVFTAAFRCAKRVRTETAIGSATTSMASAAVAVAHEVSGGLAGARALLVGAGRMARTAAQHLRGWGTGHISVINRTLAHAEVLAAEVGGTARPFEELLQEVCSADVVICSTASPAPVFNAAEMAAVLRTRGHRRLLMIDLAVPRDIAPDVRELEGVRVYDVDDIERFVSGNAARRSRELEKAESLVSEEVARFARDRTVRERVPVLATLRQWAEAIAQAEVKRTLSSLGASFSDAQRAGVEAMARAIVNKLLHGPTVRLREEGADGEGTPLVEATVKLFGLTDAAGLSGRQTSPSLPG